MSVFALGDGAPIAERWMIRPSAVDSSILVRHNAPIERRQISSAGVGVIIVLAVFFGISVCGGLILFFCLRFMRIRGFRPRFVPGRKLKEKWNKWTPGSATVRYSTSLQGRSRPSSIVMGYATPQASSRNLTGTVVPLTAPAAAAAAGQQQQLTAETRANRHASIRSIITLPPYSKDARETEETLGREGERGGIDTVVEYPETMEEEETRREEEMDSLFQIRQARRVERAEREERRRLRREARARNDTHALEALRQQRREAAQSTTSLNQTEVNSAALIQEHQSKDRGRKISEVNYRRVGIARHDGSRVRADSGASDQAPLLDSAASISGRSRSDSRSTHRFQGQHVRNQSSTSLRLVTTDFTDDGRASSEMDVPPPLPTGYSTASLTRLPTARSSEELQLQPSNDPPQYDPTNSHDHQQLGEQAPPYQSPIDTDVPASASSIPILPSIELTPFSPIEPITTSETEDAEVKRQSIVATATSASASSRLESSSI